ncbi:MAG TPA: DUF2460 domain-containing protein [Dehalococcoidia bacterium]|jgi:hypothetical protein|nr:DUF2460 domain-containing protein [Dehalococcoidia bacterium]
MKRKLFFITGLLVAAAIAGISFAQTAGTAGTTITATGPEGRFAEVVDVASLTGEHPYLRYGNYTGTTQTDQYTTPSWSPSVNAAGEITTPGDLFYIDSRGYTGDLRVSLYLNNPAQLTSNYSYLNMQVMVYELGAGTARTDTFSGDGTTTAFTLSYRPVMPKSETVTVDGVSQTRDTDYTIDNRTGVITFATAPPLGTDNISVSYTSYSASDWSEVAKFGTWYMTITSGYLSFSLNGNKQYDVTIIAGPYFCIGDGSKGSLSPAYYMDVRQA